MNESDSGFVFVVVEVAFRMAEVKVEVDVEGRCGDVVTAVGVTSLMSYGGSLARIERSSRKRVRRVLLENIEFGVGARLVDVDGAVERGLVVSMISDSNSTTATEEGWIRITR